MAGNVYFHQGAFWYIHAYGDSELDCADLFLGEILGADPDLDAIVAGRIFQGIPPEDQPYPLIAYEFASAEDDDLTYTDEQARLIYLVQVIDQIELGGSTQTVKDANKIIKRLLRDAQGSNSEGEIVKVRRKQPWRQEETRMEGG